MASVSDIALLNLEAWQVNYSDPDRSRLLAEQALAMAIAARDLSGQAYANLTLAHCHLRQLNITDSEYFAKATEALQKTLDDPRVSALLTFWRGVKFSKAEEYDLALACYQSVLEPHHPALMPIDLMRIYNALGVVHLRKGEDLAAMRCLYRALSIGQTQGAAPERAMLLSNIGYMQLCAGNPHESLHLQREACELLQLDIHPFLAPLVAANLALAYLAVGNAEGAFEAIRPLLAVTLPSGINAAILAFYHVVAAHTFAERCELDPARRHLQRAWQLIDQKDEPDIELHCCWVQSLLCRAEGDFAEATHQLKVALQHSSKIKERFYAERITLELAHSQAREGYFEQAFRSLLSHHDMLEQTLRTAERAKLQTLQTLHELERAESQRDDALEAVERADATNRELLRLNQELEHRMAEIELLQQALREQALRDPLTGLHNRRHLQEELPVAMGLAERQGHAVCIALIDVDHFKAINDGYGHTMGDEVLVMLGQILKASVRGSDFACRYGGEEFCIVFQGAQAADAAQRLVDILAMVRSAKVQCDGKSLSGVGFSAGVAEFPAHGSTQHQLLSHADAALYQAKQAGRGRVVVWGAEGCMSSPSVPDMAETTLGLDQV
ncbi:diguanylate cyclase (GGDEF)-like protein [Chitinivorax tropicus]|uniref:diguanylate cyclase n=1 Tax=Chitinivorax tropicus TaxID=714531 RepID=A0A840MK89_9PROT|nr:diguanylate cyclase [Chitinivorax tropicus]MBB5019604.1 diguanylate cyclase (GGDEF)-like protein [Chitinivorax tropicus]